MIYQLLGTPVSMHRPRFANGHVYSDQATVKLRDFLSIKLQHGKLPLFMDAIHIDITFVFEIPHSYSKKKKEMLLDKPYTKTPDVDNCAKWLLDVCHGVLYTNDKIITSVSARKIYGPIAKTIFLITQL